MKKVYLLFFIFISFMFIGNVRANTIYSIDMYIHINENGDANITENWDVKGTDGTEWYKGLGNLGNSVLSDFTVSMDGKKLHYKKWDINESLNAKKGYYGINYSAGKTELCFGKYDFNRHKFTLNYTLYSFVINTSDSQVLYWTLIDKLSNVDFQSFSVKVSSYYDFPDTLDVWGYGHKGYTYVKDGKIYMSNDGNMNNKYVVLLAKFPLNTFNTFNAQSGYYTFDDVFRDAEEGTFEYDYGEEKDISGYLIGGLVVAIFGFIIINARKKEYGYRENKKIDKSNIPFFRDIPCNKNIYYANALISLNNFNYNEGNILGAILLKWIKSGKVIIKNQTVGILNKETSVIDLTLNPTFDNHMENEIFNIMYTASKDGILEPKELEKWCHSHYSKFLNILKNIKDKEINRLKAESYIYKRKYKDECKRLNVMDDTIYEDSKKLYGLKKFLEDFSKIDDKEAIEVHIWDEYLMFAYLFGIADKVAKQFKNLYPEIESEMASVNLDYSTISFINNLQTSSVSAANSARSAAESYSSGGGGGGSFGGGGGGGSR